MAQPFVCLLPNDRKAKFVVFEHTIKDEEVSSIGSALHALYLKLSGVARSEVIEIDVSSEII